MPSARTVMLITASSPEIRRVRRSRVLNFQQITMPYLAAFVPPSWRVIHFDEEAGPVDESIPADLVAMTFHTPSAYHAYAMAGRFRSKGIPVVLGGPHVTLMPDEAERHADAIFIGEAEEEWPRFLNDFGKGMIRKRYHPAEVPDLAVAPVPVREHFHRRDHTGGVLFATRGCTHGCEFCTLAVMYRRLFRTRPVDAVAAEFASFRGKIVIFWDDNLANDREYAKKLFRAIAPAGKWWSSQVSVEAGADEEFLRLAALSGCKQLFLGLESLSQASMDGAGKKFNRVDRYARIIDRIHAHGIAVQAGIVFGFDHDDETIFEKTVRFLDASGVQNATFNILTPYPGTPLFLRLQREGRILSRDWRRYNGRGDVVFTPKLMSPEILRDGFIYATKHFYSAGSIMRRLARSPVGLWWTLPLNTAYASALLLHPVSVPALPSLTAEYLPESGPLPA